MNISWDQFKNLVTNGAHYKYIEDSESVNITVNYGGLEHQVEITKTVTNKQTREEENTIEYSEFETSYRDGEVLLLENSAVIQPFSSKIIGNKKVFTRVIGEEYDIIQGVNIIDFSIPYNQVKFNELEIINAEIGDKVTLSIKDTSTGSYSTVPNYTLNTFGNNVNMNNQYYKRFSNYDADLYIGMRIYIEFESISTKKVYINYILHELK